MIQENNCYTQQKSFQTCVQHVHRRLSHKIRSPPQPEILGSLVRKDQWLPKI